jgi:hypothetical protein
MYFTIDETLDDIDSILDGNYPDKLENYYYPIGRCAILKNINILYEKNDFLKNLKNTLSIYPDKLSKILAEYHLKELEDIEDLERAVIRKDILFYHFALDIALDHFLQALFALNRTFFPSRKRTMSFIEHFKCKPDRCDEKLLNIARLGSCAEELDESFDLWKAVVNELRMCIN